MSRYTFTHDKGFIVFTDTETNRQYEMNINSGIFKNAASGREIKGMPVGFGKFLDNYCGNDMVVYLMHRLRGLPRRYGVNEYYYLATNLLIFQRASDYLNLVDRIQNLGVVWNNSRDFEIETLDFVNKHFKMFSAYCRNTENPIVTDFVRRYEKQFYLNSIHADKYNLTDEAKDYIFNRKGEQFFQPNSEYLPYALYYLSRGLYEFSDTDASFKLREFFRMCDALEQKPQKEDFYRLYINTKRTYEMNKAEIDANALKRNYNRKRNALSFENDDFIVIIPQTADEFKAEAEAQHNCVYSSYLSHVINGDTYVVFIRAKSNPTKSLITCEVSTCGAIYQYLGMLNSIPTNEAILNFKYEYQKHITQTWNK